MTAPQIDADGCRVRDAIAAYFDRRIEATTKRAENAEDETVEALARTLLARHISNKGDVLAAHLSKCSTCEGAIVENEPREPVRCRTYQQVTDFTSEDIAWCVEQVKKVKSATLRVRAEIALEYAKGAQERYLRSHLDQCEECT